MGHPKPAVSTRRHGVRIDRSRRQWAVPQTREEAIDSIAEIGRLQRERRRLEAAMNEELAAVRARHEAEAAPLALAIDGLSQAVGLWAEANRAQLTDNGRTRTAKLASGDLGWRLSPPSVQVDGEAAVLEELHRRGLQRFVRVRESLNKEAVLHEPEAVADVPGIGIVQREDFIIRPYATDLDEPA